MREYNLGEVELRIYIDLNNRVRVDESPDARLAKAISFVRMAEKALGEIDGGVARLIRAKQAAGQSTTRLRLAQAKLLRRRHRITQTSAA